MLSFSTISICKYVAHDRDPQEASRRKRLSSFTFFSFSSKMKRSIKPYLCRLIENSYPVSFFYAKEMFDIYYIEKIQKSFFFQTFFDNLFIKWYTNNTVIFLYWYKIFPIMGTSNKVILVI